MATNERDPTLPAGSVLVIDDEPLNHRLLHRILDPAGFKLAEALGVTEGFERLSADPDRFDVVLLDRRLRDGDGLDLLRRMKEDARLAPLPVVLLTALGDPAEIVEGLEAGAFYYLPKPYDRRALLAVTRAAVADRARDREIHSALRRASSTMRLLAGGDFSFRTLEEARALAILVAGATPDPSRVALGLAELLVNAVEHGNLGIGYREKGDLLSENRWMEEIERRLNAPEYLSRHAALRFDRSATEIVIRVTDEGEGFAWRDFLEFHPERAFDANGRGIALARSLSFDRLVYEADGRTAVATILLGKETRADA